MKLTVVIVIFAWQSFEHAKPWGRHPYQRSERVPQKLQQRWDLCELDVLQVLRNRLFPTDFNTFQVSFIVVVDSNMFYVFTPWIGWNDPIWLWKFVSRIVLHPLLKTLKVVGTWRHQTIHTHSFNWFVLIPMSKWATRWGVSTNQSSFPAPPFVCFFFAFRGYIFIYHHMMLKTPQRWNCLPLFRCQRRVMKLLHQSRRILTRLSGENHGPTKFVLYFHLSGWFQP